MADETPSTERTGKRTWSFHDRYASDDEFRRQVDEGRKRRQSERTHAAVTDSLAMVKNKKRLY